MRSNSAHLTPDGRGDRLTKTISPNPLFSVQVTWPSLPQLGIPSPIKISSFLTTSATHHGPLQAAGFHLKVTNNDGAPPTPDCYQHSTLDCGSSSLITTPTNLVLSRSRIINNTLESVLTFTFSDAAGNASATVLEQVGRGGSKAARLNKDGHLIKDYYDLPQTSALIGAPGHNSFYQTPDFYSFSFLTTTTFSVSP